MNALTLFTPAVFRTLPFDLVDHFLSNSLNETNLYHPHTNVIEDKDKFQIELALPGFTREQISMNYLKNVLTIKSNLEENTSDEKKYITREFGQKNFNKQFLLPRTLDTEKITAEFNNGILLINIPKKEEVKVKEPVEVQIQ